MCITLFFAVYVSSTIVPDDLFVLSCIQFPEILRREHPGEDVFSYAYQQEERQWEQYPGIRDPCYPKAHQKVHDLKQRESHDVFEWHGLHVGCLEAFQGAAFVKQIVK